MSRPDPSQSRANVFVSFRKVSIASSVRDGRVLLMAKKNLARRRSPRRFIEVPFRKRGLRPEPPAPRIMGPSEL